MSILNFFGGKTKNEQLKTKIEPIVTEAWKYYSWNKSIFEQDLVVACIDSLARNIAKAELRAIRIKNPSEAAEIDTKSDIARVLRRPNPYMTQYDFLYKLAAMYFASNNVFIYPEYVDETLVNLWPVNYEDFKIYENDSGIKIVQFRMNYWRTYTIPYSKIIHLRNHYFSDDLFGDENEKPLNPALELNNAQNQGIIGGIKNSALIRGILSTTQVLKDEDLEKAKARFMEDNLKASNSGGVMAIDGKFQYKDIESKPYMIDAETMRETKNKYFNYFGVNENFLQNKFTSEEYEAIYEGKLEPFAIMLTQAMTAILYTDRERGFGNAIEASMNRVKYQSTKAAVSVINATRELGLFRRDEYREMLGYPPLGPENGGNDILIATNNYSTEGENNDGEY